MEYITLKEKTGLKRFGIRTADGVDTGEYIEIDIEDMDLPIRANECQKKHAENLKKLQSKIAEAEQKTDIKNETEIISEKESFVLEALREFYAAEEEALDNVLGQGTTKKLLAGRKPYVTMFDDINEYLEQIMPTMEETQKSLENKIRTKYHEEKEDNIL